MKKIEKIFLWNGIIFLFLLLIWFFSVVIYETVWLDISTSPELAWTDGVLLGLLGISLISLLAWAIALIYRLEKEC